MKLETVINELVLRGIRSLDELEPAVIERLLVRVMIEGRIDTELEIDDIVGTVDVYSACAGRPIYFRERVVAAIERTMHKRAMDELEEAFSDAVFEHESAA